MLLLHVLHITYIHVHVKYRTMCEQSVFMYIYIHECNVLHLYCCAFAV